MTTKAKAEQWPRTVRLSIQPDRDVEVTETEFTELSVQGLILDGTKTEESAQ